MAETKKYKRIKAHGLTVTIQNPPPEVEDEEIFAEVTIDGYELNISILFKTDGTYSISHKVAEWQPIPIFGPSGTSGVES
jgi:hypothetical protein